MSNNSTRKIRREFAYIQKQMIDSHPYCELCGATENLEVHHITPLALGGTNEITNLQVLCHYCHHHNENVTKIHSEAIKTGVNTTNKLERLEPLISYWDLMCAFHKAVNEESFLGLETLLDIINYDRGVCRQQPRRMFEVIKAHPEIYYNSKYEDFFIKGDNNEEQAMRGKHISSRKTGKSTGRPKTKLPAEWDSKIAAWRAGQITATQAMDDMGLPRTTFYRLVKTNDVNKEELN